MENNTKILAESVLHILTGLGVVRNTICDAYERNKETITVDVVILSNVYTSLIYAAKPFMNVKLEDIKQYIDLCPEAMEGFEEDFNNIQNDAWIAGEMDSHSELSMRHVEYSKVYMTSKKPKKTK